MIKQFIDGPAGHVGTTLDALLLIDSRDAPHWLRHPSLHELA